MNYVCCAMRMQQELIRLPSWMEPMRAEQYEQRCGECSESGDYGDGGSRHQRRTSRNVRGRAVRSPVVMSAQATWAPGMVAVRTATHTRKLRPPYHIRSAGLEHDHVISCTVASHQVGTILCLLGLLLG